MELLLFNGYRAFLKKNYGGTSKYLSGVPVSEMAFYIVAIIFAIFNFGYNIVVLNRVTVVSLCIEIGMCILLHYHTENYLIKTTNTTLVTYKVHCEKVYCWLGEVGINTSFENIKELKMRIEKQIEPLLGQSDRDAENVKYILKIIIIPLFLSMYSIWMTSKTSFTSLFQGALSIALFLCSVGIILHLFYSALSFRKKYRLEQLKSFAGDLQGILDTQFKEKLF